MFYCEKCNNLYDITNTEIVQTGGDDDYSKIIDDVVNEKEITVKKIDLAQLKTAIKKKVKNPEEYGYILNKILDQMEKKGIEKTKYIIKESFICTNRACGFKTKIPDGTKIFGKSDDKSNISNNKINYTNIAKDPTLFTTTNYVCSNEKCESHKDPRKRKAKVFRPNKLYYGVQLICTTCFTVNK